MKSLRQHRLAATSKTREKTGWAPAASLSVALFLSSLATTAHSQQPPPVTTNWLSKISDEGADTVRPLLGIQAEASAIVGRLSGAVQFPGRGGCAYCAANMFLAFEQGGNRPPLPAGVDLQFSSTSASELATATHGDLMLIDMDTQADQLAFLTENLGSGDHAIISIKIQLLTDGRIGPHAVNVAHVEGELRVFDVAEIEAGHLPADGVPLRDFFENGVVPGAYRIVENQVSNIRVQALIRTSMRDYSFPLGPRFVVATSPTKTGRPMAVTVEFPPSTPGARQVLMRGDELAAQLKMASAQAKKKLKKKLKRQGCAAPT